MRAVVPVVVGSVCMVLTLVSVGAGLVLYRFRDRPNRPDRSFRKRSALPPVTHAATSKPLSPQSIERRKYVTAVASVCHHLESLSLVVVALCAYETSTVACSGVIESRFFVPFVVLVALLAGSSSVVQLITSASKSSAWTRHRGLVLAMGFRAALHLMLGAGVLMMVEELHKRTSLSAFFGSCGSVAYWSSALFLLQAAFGSANSVHDSTYGGGSLSVFGFLVSVLFDVPVTGLVWTVCLLHAYGVSAETAGTGTVGQGRDLVAINLLVVPSVNSYLTAALSWGMQHGPRTPQDSPGRLTAVDIILGMGLAVVALADFVAVAGGFGNLLPETSLVSSHRLFLALLSVLTAGLLIKCVVFFSGFWKLSSDGFADQWCRDLVGHLSAATTRQKRFALLAVLLSAGPVLFVSACLVGDAPRSSGRAWLCLAQALLLLVVFALLGMAAGRLHIGWCDVVAGVLESFSEYPQAVELSAKVHEPLPKVPIQLSESHFMVSTSPSMSTWIGSLLLVVGTAFVLVLHLAYPWKGLPLAFLHVHAGPTIYYVFSLTLAVICILFGTSLIGISVLSSLSTRKVGAVRTRLRRDTEEHRLTLCQWTRDKSSLLGRAGLLRDKDVSQWTSEDVAFFVGDVLGLPGALKGIAGEGVCGVTLCHLFGDNSHEGPEDGSSLFSLTPSQCARVAAHFRALFAYRATHDGRQPSLLDQGRDWTLLSRCELDHLRGALEARDIDLCVLPTLDPRKLLEDLGDLAQPLATRLSLLSLWAMLNSKYPEPIPRGWQLPLLSVADLSAWFRASGLPEVARSCTQNHITGQVLFALAIPRLKQYLLGLPAGTWNQDNSEDSPALPEELEELTSTLGVTEINRVSFVLLIETQLRMRPVPGSPEACRKEFWTAHGVAAWLQGVLGMPDAEFRETKSRVLRHGVHGGVLLDRTNFPDDGLMALLHVRSPSHRAAFREYRNEAISERHEPHARHTDSIGAQISPRRAGEVSVAVALPRSATTDGLCFRCQRTPSQSLLRDCGHVVLCDACASELSREPGAECPLCRRPVVSRPAPTAFFFSRQTRQADADFF